MTIQYSPDNFLKVMFGYWRGSLFKMVFKMMGFYLIVYYAFYFTYHFALPDEPDYNERNCALEANETKRAREILKTPPEVLPSQIGIPDEYVAPQPSDSDLDFDPSSTAGPRNRRTPCVRSGKQIWRWIVAYVRDIEHYYDLSFLLGFFVMLIVSRWWSQAVLVILKCQPDTFIRTMCSFVAIKDQKSRILRRTFARWCICLQALSWRSVSSRLLRRVPTEEHLVTIGLLTEKELELLKMTSVSGYDRYMIPAMWIFNLINRCKTERLIDSWQATAAKERLEEFYDAHRSLWIYSWLSVPLAYTQVAFLATHAFFLVTVLGRQPVLATDADTFFPFFMCIQFLFYMGWLQVAEALIDPFGEDDEDYEMNYLLDHNARNAFFIADNVERTCTSIVPELRDANWNVRYDYEIPHTIASGRISELIPKGNSDVRKYKPSRDDLKTYEKVVETWQRQVTAGKQKLTKEEDDDEVKKDPISVQIKVSSPDESD